ncbi:MAG TPA: hypothetical protein VHB77_06900 [Planctomycetaceae bacterium]|nr:hypothetical protein [Planctomycetaceae bacterium]
MLVRKTCVTALVFGIVAVVANLVFALDVPLPETKDQLGLKYDVAAEDLGNGRVDFVLTVRDEGRLKPLDSVDLVISGGARCGGANDLSLSLATTSREGKITTHVLLSKDLAARAEFRLRNYSLNGETQPFKYYYHSIALAPSLDAAKVTEQLSQNN